jgi:ribosomal protein S18 acetylase RimI-like enzyme
LPRLAAVFAPDSRASDHAARFAVQRRGEGAYLIAWHGDAPVGHLVIRWQGPAHDLTGQYPPATPYLEAAATRPDYRNRGVATRLIREAERLARARKYTQIGLTVSSKENPVARRLYEGLGDRAWGGGEYPASWEYETEAGEKVTGSGVFVYLIKTL